MIGTVELTKAQAQVVVKNFITAKGKFAEEVPETNGCIKLENNVTLRKLPVVFRKNDPRSKAYRLKGDEQAMNKIISVVNKNSTKPVVMTIKMA